MLSWWSWSQFGLHKKNMIVSCIYFTSVHTILLSSWSLLYFVVYFVLLHWLLWFLFISYFYFDFTLHFIATDSKDPSIKLHISIILTEWVFFLYRLSYRILQLPQCPDKTLCQLDLHSSVIVRVKWLRKENKNMSTLSRCE